MTVDEILRSLGYTDRRGRRWVKFTDETWAHFSETGREDVRVWGDLPMRLLIERDMHRDVCPGLSWCVYHPVPMVLLAGYYAPWTVVYPQVGNYADYDTHDEAMDAARALAVGE